MFTVRGKNTRKAAILRNEQRRLGAYDPGALANLAMPRPGNRRGQLHAMRAFAVRPNARIAQRPRTIRTTRTNRRKPVRPAKSWWASLFG